MRTAGLICAGLVLLVAGIAVGQTTQGLDVYWDAGQYKNAPSAEQRAYLMGALDAFEYAAYGTHAGTEVGKCFTKSFASSTSIRDVEALVDPRLYDAARKDLAAVSVIAVAVMERCTK